jgi:regulator of PEP synthase PpsR (kinase-PPPase family)
MLWTCHAGYFHLHLISDSTGETLITVARSGRADQQRRKKVTGKWVSPVTISFIDTVSVGNKTRDPKQALHFGQCQT